MAVMAIAVVGAGIGAYFGYAAVGYAVGSLIGSMLFPPKAPTQYSSQSLIDLKITGTDYGQTIPWVRGTVAIPGQIWWNSDRIPNYNTTVTNAGGKGGGGGSQSIKTTISYSMDVLYGLTDHEIAGISRIWANGALIFDTRNGVDGPTLDASANSPYWSRLTVYTGADDQQPDPDYEAAVGVGNAPAYTGRSTVFIKNFQLGETGAIPNLVFEVVSNGTTEIIGLLPSPLATLGSLYEGNIPLINANIVSLFFNSNAGSPNSLLAISARTGAGMGIANYPAEFRRPLGVDLNGNLWQGNDVSKLYRVEPNGKSKYINLSGAPPSNRIEGDTQRRIWQSSGGFSMLRYSDIDLAIHSATVSNYALPAGWAGLQCVPMGGITVGRMYVHNNTNSQTFRIGYYDTETGVPTVLYTSANSFQGSPCMDYNGYCWFTDSTSSGHTLLKKMDSTGTIVATVELPGASTQIAVSGVILSIAADGRLYVQAATASSGNIPNVSTKLYAIDVVANTIVYESAVITDTIQLIVLPYAPNGFIYRVIVGSGNDTIIPVKAGPEAAVVTAIAPTLAQVQADICARAEMDPTQIDTSALLTITKQFRGIVWGDTQPPRSMSELLMGVYAYEAYLSDKLYFVPRGRVVADTITYDELGAVDTDDASSDSSTVEALPLKKSNDIETPAKVLIKFWDYDSDYQWGTVIADRVVTTMEDTTESIQVPIVLKAAEAKQSADARILDWAAGDLGTTISVLCDKMKLIPTDAISVQLKDGSYQRFRITKRSDFYPRLEFDVVSDDASVIVSAGTTDDGSVVGTLSAPSDTLMSILDIALLQDEDDGPGFYIAAKGVDTPWPGCVVLESPDDITYSQVQTVEESATMGWTTTVLPNFTGGRIFDNNSSVTITIGSSNNLPASVTRQALLDDYTVNAFLIGDEIVQAQTVTLVSPGIYTLTNLLRGCQGTEWAISTHYAGDVVVALTTQGLRRIPLTLSELGTTEYWKGVTKGRPVDTALSQEFKCLGVSQIPLTPFDFRVSRDTSNNCTLTWQRRTRFACKTIGAMGIIIPLGEQAEQYEVELYTNNTYATLIRIVTVTGAPTLAYTAAQQTLDGLTPGAAINVRIYQISGTVGRGRVLQASA